MAVSPSDWSAKLQSLKHNQPVVYIEISRDGHGLATADDEGQVKIWDGRTGTLKYTISTDASVIALGVTKRENISRCYPSMVMLASGISA